MKLMTDLCWQCQKVSTAIERSAYLSEEEKSEAVRSAQEHLHIVQIQRSFYTASCKDCSRSVKAHFQNHASFSPPPPSSYHPPNSNAMKVHCSFDYAQQVCPNDTKSMILFAKTINFTSPGQEK
jgi:hypothetical protein